MSWGNPAFGSGLKALGPPNQQKPQALNQGVGVRPTPAGGMAGGGGHSSVGPSPVWAASRGERVPFLGAPQCVLEPWAGGASRVVGHSQS